MKVKPINKLVGEHLRLIRLSKNMNLEVLSDELDISVSTLSNLERGETEISISRLFQILNILKYDIIDFFQEILRQHEDSDAVSDLRFKYNSKSTSQLELEIEWIKREIEKLKKS